MSRSTPSGRGPVEEIDRAVAVGQRPGAAAGAGAGRAVEGGPLGVNVAPSSFERATQIRRRASPGLGVLGPAVPGDVDVPRCVGGDRPAPVEGGGPLHQVALRLEGLPAGVGPRVEHRRAAGRVPRPGAVRAVPGDVDPPPFPSAICPPRIVPIAIAEPGWLLTRTGVENRSSPGADGV